MHQWNVVLILLLSLSQDNSRRTKVESEDENNDYFWNIILNTVVDLNSCTQNELGHFRRYRYQTYFSTKKLTHFLQISNLDSVESNFNGGKSFFPQLTKNQTNLLEFLFTWHLKNDRVPLGLLEQCKKIFEGGLAYLPDKPYTIKFKPSAIRVQATPYTWLSPP